MGLINSQNPTSITTGTGTEVTNVSNISGNGVEYSSPSVGTKVNDGTNDRIIVGYDKDGFGTGVNYGIKVSKPGYDVDTATDAQLLMSSAFNMLKVYATGTVTLTTSGGSPRTANTVVTHNLGYSPVVVGSVVQSTGLSSEIMAFPGAYYIHDGSVFRVRVIGEYFATSLTALTLQIREDVGAGTWTVRYYILIETGGV